MAFNQIKFEAFHGNVSPNLARLYVRAVDVPTETISENLVVQGLVQGPHCPGTRMLTARFPLKDLGPGETPLAAAEIPDPCCWTDELPAVYEITASLYSGKHEIATQTFSFGIRALGVGGTNFYRMGKRVVIRALNASMLAETALSHWKETLATMIAEDPADKLCAEASALGVPLLARFTNAAPPTIDRLRKLASFAAVAGVILESETELDHAVGGLHPNWLCIEQRPPRCELPAARWANALLVPADDAARLVHTANVPILAFRPLESRLPLEQARQSCDRLQRDLARSGQFAGYVV